jgi:hypothetical protein
MIMIPSDRHRDCSVAAHWQAGSPSHHGGTGMSPIERRPGLGLRVGLGLGPTVSAVLNTGRLPATLSGTIRLGVTLRLAT